MVFFLRQVFCFLGGFCLLSAETLKFFLKRPLAVTEKKRPKKCRSVAEPVWFSRSLFRS